MENIIDLAVIGVSKSGKSTFISNLFSKKTCEQLSEISSENTEGQTKLPVHYILENGDIDNGLMINDICWNFEDPDEKDTLSDSKKSKALKYVCDFLNIESQNNEEFFESEEFKKRIQEADCIDFISKIANNLDICKSGIISHIELKGSACDEVKKILENQNLNAIKLRDTRGFMDETIDDFNNMANNSEKLSEYERSVSLSDLRDNEPENKFAEIMLCERGIKNVDGIIFMTRTGEDDLGKKTAKNMYAPLLRYIINKYPLFVAARTDVLTRKMACDNMDYTEGCNEILNDEWFSGLDNIRKLIDGFKEKITSEKEYEKIILNRHYKEMLVADVSDKMKCEEEVWNIYKCSVVETINTVIEGIKSYRSNLEEAKKYFNKFLKPEQYADKITEISGNLFEDSIRDDYWSIYCYYSPTTLYNLNFLSDKIKETENYYGGFIGCRGGITPRSKYGSAASVLNAAYRMFEDITEGITKSILKEYYSAISATNEEVNEKLASMRDMMEKFLRDQSAYYSTYKCNIIRVSNAENAYNKTHEECKNQNIHFKYVVYNLIRRIIADLFILLSKQDNI
ncbi:MAG: hypothetical protein PUE12_02640 [Oscillospiraceae bacterium]|nr:hypothetical protein [Oscillospiraceae bacterium]